MLKVSAEGLGQQSVTAVSPLVTDRRLSHD